MALARNTLHKMIMREAAVCSRMKPKSGYNRDRWSIETHELRRDGKPVFSYDLSNNDGGWARVHHEIGFLSRADAKKEAIAKIYELESQ